MKKLCVLFLASVLIVACGGGNGGAGTAPEISDLRSSRSSAQIGEGGGAVEVTVTVDFVDIDGDCDFARIRGRECGVGDWLVYDTDLEGVSGRTSGTIQLTRAVDTRSCPASTNDTIQVSVFDKQGNQSNILNGSFTFYE